MHAWRGRAAGRKPPVTQSAQPGSCPRPNANVCTISSSAKRPCTPCRSRAPMQSTRLMLVSTPFPSRNVAHAAYRGPHHSRIAQNTVHLTGVDIPSHFVQSHATGVQGRGPQALLPPNSHPPLNTQWYKEFCKVPLHNSSACSSAALLPPQKQRYWTHPYPPSTSSPGSLPRAKGSALPLTSTQVPRTPSSYP